MIGLKRGTVKLVHHQTSWVKYFERERDRLEQTFGPHIQGIEHVGSTAIPGIKAKPVIDIILGVRTLRHAEKSLFKLSSLGYIYRPSTHQHNRWQRLYVKGGEQKRKVYLHVIKYRGEKWRDYLFFRDTLRTNNTLARRYEQLKQRLADLHADNREQYTQAKEKFIAGVLIKRH